MTDSTRLPATDLHQLQQHAEQAAALLKSMGNSRRLLILCMLAHAPGTGAGELAKATGLSPSATSQHLAKMREEGLLDSVRDAQRICYFIKHPAVADLIGVLKAFYCP